MAKSRRKVSKLRCIWAKKVAQLLGSLCSGQIVWVCRGCFVVKQPYMLLFLGLPAGSFSYVKPHFPHPHWRFE